MFKYQLAKTEDGKDIEINRASVIEKRGHVIKFSLEELAQNHIALEKVNKELTAQSELQLAKMKNIREHHAFIDKLTPEELFTANMFFEAKLIYTQCIAKLKEIEDQLTSDRKEIADIKKQIPELDIPEPVAIPQRPRGVMEAINSATENQEDGQPAGAR